MTENNYSRLPVWAQKEFDRKNQTIAELRNQIKEAHGEFRKGAQIFRGAGAMDDDIPIGDVHDRIRFNSKPDSEMYEFEVYWEDDGGLAIRALESLFIKPQSGNAITVYNSHWNALKRR